jgi:periplasmic divalent cation tolerance protein
MQTDSHIRLIYATFPDTDSARTAGEVLVRERLAACVNMWPGMVSIYRWQGEIEEANEVVFLAKTTLSQSAAAIAALRAAHPYDEPAVLSLPVEDGSAGFLHWIRKETAGPV